MAKRRRRLALLVATILSTTFTAMNGGSVSAGPGCTVKTASGKTFTVPPGLFDARAVRSHVDGILLLQNGTAIANLRFEMASPQCTGGDIVFDAITMRASRWQYTFKHSSVDRLGAHRQSFAKVPADANPAIPGQAIALQAGSKNLLVAFHPYAKDQESPQAPPTGSSAYCAITVERIDSSFSGVGVHASSNAWIPNPKLQFAHNGSAKTCPRTWPEFCKADVKLMFAEKCYAPFRIGSYCLSSYQDDYLVSHGYCDDAQTFTDEMQNVWKVLPKDSFVRDWAHVSKARSVDEFTGNVNVKGQRFRGNAADMIFVATHGGVNTFDAHISLWENNASLNTNSDGIRLGQIPGRLSVLALESCWVLSGNNVDLSTDKNGNSNNGKFDSSNLDSPVSAGRMFDRWGSVFKGGLRIAVGGADGVTMWDIFSSTDDNPSSFVDKLTDRPIVDAFMDAWTNGDVEQHVGGIASGTSKNDCLSRLLLTRFASVRALPRLYDDQVRFLCQVHQFHD